MRLDLPDELPRPQATVLSEMAERNLADHGTGFLGLVLTGSAARGLATERSDLDVFVILCDEAAEHRRTEHSPTVDEIPVSWTELTTIPPFGTEDWWGRWAFAWAPVLLDRTADGSITTHVERQATLSPEEADHLLIEDDRLDGWVNFAYRSLKSDRDGRRREARLDAAESVPWLLDVVFGTAGRVRPYNKYLPWELRTHSLPDWPADELLALLDRTLDGDPSAVRETFRRVRSVCATYDEARGHRRTSDMIDGWGDQLAVFD